MSWYKPKSIGVVKNLALLANITTGTNSVLVRELVETRENIIDSDQYLSFVKNEGESISRVYVNGLLVGITQKPQELYQEIKLLKDEKTLGDQVSIILNTDDSEIRIFSDAGRYIRPVLNMSEGKLLYNSEIHSNLTWEDLLDQNVIKYIDSNEVENSLIAMYPGDIYKYSGGDEKGTKQTFDYCEIHPSAMLGVCSSVIPFSSHNQCPRCIYQSSMFKQALGIYSLAYQNRFDTVAHVLHYPQKPLIETRYNKILHYDEMLSGINPVVAIMSYGGLITIEPVKVMLKT